MGASCVFPINTRIKTQMLYVDARWHYINTLTCRWIYDLIELHRYPDLVSEQQFFLMNEFSNV